MFLSIYLSLSISTSKWRYEYFLSGMAVARYLKGPLTCNGMGKISGKSRHLFYRLVKLTAKHISLNSPLISYSKNSLKKLRNQNFIFKLKFCDIKMVKIVTIAKFRGHSRFNHLHNDKSYTCSYSLSA